MYLSREIRFALVTPGSVHDRKPGNSWAGWPSTNLVVPQLVLRCVIKGQQDPATGYLCNIKTVDEILRSIVTNRLIPAAIETRTAESILQTAYRELLARWNRDSTIALLSLELSPYLSYSIDAEDNMNKTQELPCTVQLTQQFEFSAAHRLHCDELSSDDNKRLFGKCNNAAGHGHNYVVEVTLSNLLGSDRSQVIELENFESIVKQRVIDRLDHKHLNQDIEYFTDVNPTVENIAVAIFDWLAGQFREAKLEKVKVYETPKTWAEYTGDI